jgi:arabinan endo-1,5-alpha-L-arabinosidase
MPAVGGPGSSDGAGRGGGVSGGGVGGAGGAAGSGAAGAGGDGPSSGAGPLGGGAGQGSAGSGGDGVGGAAAGGGAGGSGAPGDRCEVSRFDAAKPPKVLELTGNLGTHDPVVLEAAGKFFLFATGDNLAAKTSSDLLAWQAAPEPLPRAARPAWVAEQVPGVSNLWAPDASYFGGRYHLYYSASTFGKNRSCIGHLTRASLTEGSWTDEGSVICSATSDDYNAIDPNVIVDEAGTPWLAFGSFWSGIKLIELDERGARDGTSLTALASRPSASGALEAPFLVRRCGYYYLFTSWDSCCKGADSTYHVRVGRSRSLSEPFVDKDGKPLLQGGGSLVVQGGPRYKGPGHNAVLFTKDGSYNVYHAYDANDNGAPVLRIAELAWDEQGWPVSAGP